ncbi:MAG: ABC transporter substrate-binding protein [Brevinema sp.]
MKKFWIPAFLAILSSCGGQDVQGSLLSPAFLDSTKSNPALKRANAKDTLVVGSLEMSGNFLPIYYVTAYDVQVTSLVFESLLSLDEQGNFIPYLAETMPTVSSDGKSYTVKLKKGIKFHSGNEMTADDVVFSAKVLADPSYDGRFASAVQDMLGYEEYSQGKTKIFRGVEKIDDYTVRINFKEPLFSNLALVSITVMDSKFYAYNHGDVSPIKAKMRDLSGTGAYILKEYKPKQFALLEANPNYHGTPPKIKKIIIKNVSPSTDVQELVRGEIDILPSISEPEKLITANKTGFIDRIQYPRHGYGYLMFNSSIAPTDDKRVRQALSYGLNRKAIGDIYFKGLSDLVDAPMSKIYWTYDDSLEEKMISYHYSPEKASELLENAGWIMESDGFRYKDGVKFSLDWVATKDNPIVDVIIPVLLDNYKSLGLEIRIQQIDFTSLIDKVYNERSGFHMYNMALSEAAIPSPYNVWHSRLNKRGGSNTGQYTNFILDELLDRMKRSLDRDIFKALWQEHVLILNEDMPMLPLYTNYFTDLVNRRVKNLKTSSLRPWYAVIDEVELSDE